MVLLFMNINVLVTQNTIIGYLKMINRIKPHIRGVFCLWEDWYSYDVYGFIYMLYSPPHLLIKVIPPY